MAITHILCAHLHAAAPKLCYKLPPSTLGISCRHYFDSTYGYLLVKDNMKLSAFALIALLQRSQAALRFGCGTVTIQRLDPVVEPGNTPSSHLHQVHIYPIVSTKPPC